MTTRIADEDLARMMELIKDSDSVELKLTVPDNDIRSTAMSLDLDPLEAQIRQVVFFDTPDLALNRAGVVVRARRIQGGKGDSVVKLRPVVPAELPEHMRRSPSLGVEVDAMPGGYVCSASIKGKTTAAKVAEVIHGKARVRSLFSKDQKAFFETHRPQEVGWDDLVMLGPINILKLKFAPEDFERVMVAELWIYPDGSRILELSTKCLPNEAFQVATEARLYLTDHGVDLAGEQQTKTKTTLEYFAAIRADEADST